MEERSWRRNPGGEIMEKMMEDKSCRTNREGPLEAEAPRRPPGDIKEAPKRYPGGPQETPRTLPGPPRGTQRRPEAPRRHPEKPRRQPGDQEGLWGKMSWNNQAFQRKLPDQAVAHRWERPDPHQVCSIAAEVAGSKRDIVRFRKHPFVRYTVRTPTAKAPWRINFLDMSQIECSGMMQDTPAERNSYFQTCSKSTNDDINNSICSE